MTDVESRYLRAAFAAEPGSAEVWATLPTVKRESWSSWVGSAVRPWERRRRARDVAQALLNGYLSPQAPRRGSELFWALLEDFPWL